MESAQKIVNPTPSDLLSEGNYRRIARGSKRAPQHVSRILRGMAGMSFETAILIADAAGVSMDELRKHWEPRRKSHRAGQRRGRKSAKPRFSPEVVEAAEAALKEEVA